MSMDMGSGSGPRSEINVTPLVDVVLVLLIIFMVVQPLLQMGYQVQVPPKNESAANNPPPTDQLVVSVTPNKDVFINKDKIDPANLPIRLEAGRRLHQPDIALLHQIAHRQPVIAKTHHRGDDKPGISAHQFMQRQHVGLLAPAPSE